ncbi:MAG: PEP-CTERM sorting domain-containing protein [Betaproteobacteria bacterium]|nr:PEP-CTERM sorting domain-containing protein [Betaproteobacteria bacterium]
MTYFAWRGWPIIVHARRAGFVDRGQDAPSDSKDSDSGFGNSRLFVLTPVPEPETHAMMLLGLAVIGCRLRRKTIQPRAAAIVAAR